MIRSLTFVPAMMCAAAIAWAQTPAGQPQPTTQPPAAQAPAQPSESATVSKITYAGCVKPGTAPDTWILESAEMIPPAKPGQSTAGTSGTMKTTLNLATKPGTDLKPHANHKVEVTGTVAPAKPAMPSSPPAASAAGQAVRQDFAVDSLKMVATTCP